MKTLQNNSDVFNLNYVPRDLLVREKEAEQIMEDSGVGRKLVFGAKDLGKTVTARWIAERHAPDKFVYIPCDTSLRMTLAPVIGRIAFSGNESLREFLSSESGRGKVILFDDIHKLAKKSDKDLNNVLYDFVDHFPKMRYVLITNWPPDRFWNSLADDTKSRYLGIPNIIFTLYNAEQVAQIIRQRIKVAGATATAGAVNCLAALYARDGVPLRDVFSMLYEAVKKSSTLNETLVKTAMANESARDFSKSFESLTKRDALALGAINMAQIKHAQTSILGDAMEPEVEFRPAYDTFIHLLKRASQYTVSDETFRQSVSALSEMGLVKTWVRDDLRGTPRKYKTTAPYNAVWRGFVAYFKKQFGEDLSTEIPA